MSLTRPDGLLVHPIAESSLHNRKQRPAALRAHCCAFRRDLPVLEGNSDDLEHIQGACKVPSPVGRRGSRALARNPGEESVAIHLWGQEEGGTGELIAGMMLAIANVGLPCALAQCLTIRLSTSQRQACCLDHPIKNGHETRKARCSCGCSSEWLISLQMTVILRSIPCMHH